MRDLLEAARRVEAGSQLVGEGFNVHKVVRARRTDRFFVEAFRVELPAFDPSDLGADQRGAALEVFRAIGFPHPELLVVNPRGEAVATTARQATPAHLPANWASAIRTDNAVLGDTYWDGALAKGVVVFAVPIYQTGGRFLGALTAKLEGQPVQVIVDADGQHIDAYTRLS